MHLSPLWSPWGDTRARCFATQELCQGLVELLGHLAMLFLLIVRLCNHLNEEQDVILDFEKVDEVSSLWLKMVVFGKMIS